MTAATPEMFHRVISQCVQNYQALDRWLDKAEEHAKAVDVGKSDFLGPLSFV